MLLSMPSNTCSVTWAGHACRLGSGIGIDRLDTEHSPGITPTFPMARSMAFHSLERFPHRIVWNIDDRSFCLSEDGEAAAPFCCLSSRSR